MTVSGKLNASEEIVPTIITLIGDPPDELLLLDEPTLSDDEPVVVFDEVDLDDELQAVRPTPTSAPAPRPPSSPFVLPLSVSL